MQAYQNAAINRMSEYECLDLTGKITWPGGQDELVVAGGFYDIYKGNLEGYNGPVAVKYSVAYDYECIANEVRIVSRLQHPNILQYLGFTTTEPAEYRDQSSNSYLHEIRGLETPFVGIVYPWVELNLRQYLKLKPDTNRGYLCIQVIEGLIHLHDSGIIHGDLRSRTIMMTDGGNIKITGFGGSNLENETPHRDLEYQFAPRWAAPERFYTSSNRASRKSDIWSLAMEIFTGTIPYDGLPELRVISAVSNGKLPSKPKDFISIKPGYDLILWALLQSCWQFSPRDRPSVVAVRDIMNVIYREGQTASEIGGLAHTIIKRDTSLPTVIERLEDHGCLNMTSQLGYIDENSKYSGKMSDVYQARLPTGHLAAVKCLRGLTNSENRPDKVLKHTAHELYTWSISAHPNILELLGLAVFRDQLAMVAPWMEYGSLLAFIRANPEADRCNLCTQIAEGLVYMHGLGIVGNRESELTQRSDSQPPQAHGDIKGDNVVVSKDGVAKITDFGCATMKREFPVAFTVTESLNYSVRWAAPELFLEDGVSNFETDVYALGMTILEAITGDVPHKERADLAVIHTVLVKKQHPVRPVQLIPSTSKVDELWELLERCWSYEPPNRPKVPEVRDFLKTVTQGDLIITA
ncbi:Tyrosine kinase family catalytic domain containing protein [Ceratobasidium theobromae]|uniref:Tyrosine kinase family catalytic domain containing protein n=1 Tax=Ceratobasidium theobromae TaxID=1582974 RepID=A0A5N5QE50_9AGAM|nr:Tyrosine kinase family catalytic domain containing protein [Ceratobasidium theobromae]